jgi:hypothetical protein
MPATCQIDVARKFVTTSAWGALTDSDVTDSHARRAAE